MYSDQSNVMLMTMCAVEAASADKYVATIKDPDLTLPFAPVFVCLFVYPPSVFPVFFASSISENFPNPPERVEPRNF